jgi:putative NADH-flavin reductase
VSGLVRNAAALPENSHLRPVPLDIHDVPALAAALAGHDAVIHSFNPGRGRTDPDIFESFVAGERFTVGY